MGVGKFQNNTVRSTVVGGLVLLRYKEGRPKAVRDEAAGKASSNITELKQFR
jgi:hypothetical protein